MPMSNETIKALNYIVDAHNDGSDDQIRADKFKCHVAVIRSFLSLAKKTGTVVKRASSGKKFTDEEKALLGAAVKEAHAKIAELRNGHQR